MWSDVVSGLETVPDAVLTGVDASGYPAGVRCSPRPDHVHQQLRCVRPPGVDLVDGPASLLGHSHDELLWNLRSFLVRGTVRTVGSEWIFSPAAVVPGLGMAGPVGEFRSFIAARRRAGRFLSRRGLDRPAVPWRQIRQDR